VSATNSKASIWSHTLGEVKFR